MYTMHCKQLKFLPDLPMPAAIKQDQNGPITSLKPVTAVAESTRAWQTKKATSHPEASVTAVAEPTRS
ncbi:hypothetical protein A2U01_0028253 [Trifolium medium]|uniref:Uncharacterized protein n=1 Tax=Trifolium medium TaxID=97028 RepID=A0A392P566_9FABA|nr:hypothetical protein [Trifolium medium]